MSDQHPQSVSSNRVLDHTGLLLEYIGNLYMSSEYSDVCLKVGDQKFHAHRGILSQNDYFHSLLSGGMKESLQSDVELVDVNVEAFKILLKYMYTGQISLGSLEEELLLEVLCLARQFLFKDLETDLYAFFTQNLNINNVCTILDVAFLNQLGPLTKVCHSFLEGCSEGILSSQGFLSLSAAGLEGLLKSDSFYAHEIDIFRAVLQWVNRNSADLKSPEVRALLEAIRYSLMSTDELLTEVRPTGCISSETLLDALQEAKKSSLPHRGLLLPDRNLVDLRLGAEVIQGEMKATLLSRKRIDRDTSCTHHKISGTCDEGIIIKLGTPAIVNHVRMRLWDRDSRSYSYYLEVSLDMKDWVRVVDYTGYHCRSWQKLHFEARKVQFFRIVGTYDTVFHMVSFEAMYKSDNVTCKDGLMVPRHNVATPQEGAVVIEGIEPGALLNGDTRFYNWNSGYTYHKIGEGAILVQLGQPYRLDSMRLLLLDHDERSYRYLVEVSLNKTDWQVIWERSKQDCKSWQYISFTPRPVVYVRIQGNINQRYTTFACIHFECPAQVEE